MTKRKPKAAKKSATKARSAAKPAARSAKRPAAARAAAAAPANAHLIDGAASFEQIIRGAAAQRYVLRLYVTGNTSRSAEAIANVRALCDEHLAGRYELEVVDIYQQPAEAQGEQIIAAPTLVKKFPSPPRKMIGNLSDRQRVLMGLDIRPRGERAPATKENVRWVEV